MMTKDKIVRVGSLELLDALPPVQANGLEYVDTTHDDQGQDSRL
jgi:hypothetical protein